MPLLINLRHLELKNLSLSGTLSVEELDLAAVDDVVRLVHPARYELSAERAGPSVLVRGSLAVIITCVCVRCLRAFECPLVLNDWALELFPGDDETPIHNDCVDLTARVREDIVLSLPQHPLCEPECCGMPSLPASAPKRGVGSPGRGGASVWSELNKLKL